MTAEFVSGATKTSLTKLKQWFEEDKGSFESCGPYQLYASNKQPYMNFKLC